MNSKQIAALAARQRQRGLMAAQLAARPAPPEAFHVERLPETYDRDGLERVLRRVLERTSAPLRPPSAPPPPPAPEGVVELDIVQSGTMDRFVRKGSTGDSGPGRIWEVRGVTGAGRRYRVVRPDMRFGVMSMRLPPDAVLTAQPTPGIQVQYGVVLTGIPHALGRPPARAALEAVGMPPVAFANRFADGGKPAALPVSRLFYWNRIQAEYETQGTYPFAVAFGSDAVLAPVASDWRENRGLAVSLITGRDANEVFQQLSSRQVLGKILTQDGKGPTATVPEFYTAESPTPPNCLRWVTVGPGNETYEHITQSTDLTAETRIVQGLPFDLDDCAALVPTDTHFSVVIQWGFERVRNQLSAPASWGTPEVWHQNGLKTIERTTGRLRSCAVDLTIG